MPLINLLTCSPPSLAIWAWFFLLWIRSTAVTSMSKGSVSRWDTCEGDVLRVETEIDNLQHKKRARTERSESHFTALSTLEYDKRVADS